MLKRIISSVLLLLSIVTFGQAPEKVNYQAVIRDNSGAVVASQSVSLRLSVLETSISGASIYQEEHTVVTDQFGVVSLVLGTSTQKSGLFTDITWSENEYFLKVELDLNGGSNYTEMGTTQLVSVPYALHSNTSDTASFARTVESVDDADADATNEIQELRLVKDTLFLSESNYVLLGGIGNYVYESHSSPGVDFWDQGTICNFEDTAGLGLPSNRTIGESISNEEWKTIFIQLGAHDSTSYGKYIPEDVDYSLTNLRRYCYYQETLKEFVYEFTFPGGVDAAAYTTKLENAIANQKIFGTKVYQNGVLIGEGSKDDVEILVLSNFLKTHLYIKFNMFVDFDIVDSKAANIAYEVNIK